MKKQSKGFTIVELMFSTAIFAGVLLLCLSALVQIGRMYYKGVTTTQTQQAARGIIDGIAQSIQFSSATVKTPTALDGISAAPSGPSVTVGGDVVTGAVGYFCVGATRYTFAMDRMQDNSNNTARKTIKHAVWVDEPGQCASVVADVINSAVSPYRVDLMADTPSAFNGRDMLGFNMRLTRLSILPVPLVGGDGSVWQVKLTVAYGEDDLLIVDPADATRRYCKGAQIGTEFCAFSELSTIIKRRL